MFWKHRAKDTPLLPLREECNRVARAALLASGIEFDQATGLDQALIGTFVFGMIQPVLMANSLEPAQAHAITLTVFQDTLHYTPEAAAEGVQQCISGTAPGVHDTMRAIMHRGSDGHAQYLAGDTVGLAANLRDILNHFSRETE